jgi:hypothetical protein
MRKDELTNILERSMGVEPNFRLPADFAQRVTASVVRREQWKSDLQEYFYLIGSLIFLLAVTAGIYYLADKELLMHIWAFVKSNLLPLTLLFFIFNFILLADKVLLRMLFNRWKTN